MGGPILSLPRLLAEIDRSRSSVLTVSRVSSHQADNNVNENGVHISRGFTMTGRILFHGDSNDHFRQFDLESIESSRNTILGIDRQFRILLLNPAYHRFAGDNEGDKVASDYSVGSDMLAAISGPQKEFYRSFLGECFGQSEPKSHDYECSSSERYRLFKLFAYPSVSHEVLLLDHAIQVEKAQELTGSTLSKEQYIDSYGIMHQCGHCRRVRHNNSEQWDWLELAMTFKEVSHGLCDSCLSTYYPDLELSSKN